MSRVFRSLLVLVVAACGLVGFAIAAEPPAAANWDVPQTGRIVAFADVHGAYDELTELLRQTDVIDEQGNWKGGTTQLVSLGDLLDRGADSRKVLELLMHLQQQAPRAGGSVHVVLGNHETMVSSGDLRYVSAAEYAAFAGDETAAEREALFAGYAAVRTGNDAAVLRAAFDKNFPPGYIGLTRAFASNGRYGSWLLAQPLILKIGDTLFLHGGLSSTVLQYSLADANTRLKQDFVEYLGLVDTLTTQGVLPSTLDSAQRGDYLTQALAAYAVQNGKRKAPPWGAAAARFAELDTSPVFDPAGPLWYRGTALCHPYVAGFDVERVLAQWQARRVVLGHTPTASHRVTSRLDGTVILADTGMLKSVYKGRASAVLIDNGVVNVAYAGEPGSHKPEPESTQVPRQPPDLDDAALEQFLMTATVVANVAVGTGVTKPRRLTLEQNGVRLDALYKNFDTDPGMESRPYYKHAVFDQSDRYVYDVAAYKLDRMLGINRAPVAVLREIDGKRGLVELWLNDTINERDRIEMKVAFAGPCNQYEQYRLRIVWDVLVYNDDRNLTNLLWTNDDFTLLFIDHSLAFRAIEKRPKQYAKVALHVPEALRLRLQALDREQLLAQLGAYLHPQQIDSLLARRDLILRQASATGFTY